MRRAKKLNRFFNKSFARRRTSGCIDRRVQRGVSDVHGLQAGVWNGCRLKTQMAAAEEICFPEGMEHVSARWKNSRQEC